MHPPLPERLGKETKSFLNSATSLKVILAIVFITFFPGNAFAKEPLQNLLVSLPAHVKTFTAETPQVYEDEKFGVSIGYNDPAGTSITLYLYDLAVQDIPDGISSEIIRSAKEEAIGELKEVEKSGLYSDVKITVDQEIDFGLDAGKTLKMLFVSFSYNMKDQYSTEVLPIFSDMYLTGFKGYICKIRISRPEIQKEKEDEIKETIKTLLSTLTR